MLSGLSSAAHPKDQRRASQPGLGEITELGKYAMKTKFVIAYFVCGMLAGSAVALAQDSDADRSHPKAYVKDSAITTKIKSKLAAEHITSLGRIHVDTDTDGVVWLTGTGLVPAIDTSLEIIAFGE